MTYCIGFCFRSALNHSGRCLIPIRHVAKTAKSLDAEIAPYAVRSPSRHLGGSDGGEGVSGLVSRRRSPWRRQSAPGARTLVRTVDPVNPIRTRWLLYGPRNYVAGKQQAGAGTKDVEASRVRPSCRIFSRVMRRRAASPDPNEHLDPMRRTRRRLLPKKAPPDLASMPALPRR